MERPEVERFRLAVARRSDQRSSVEFFKREASQGAERIEVSKRPEVERRVVSKFFEVSKRPEVERRVLI